MDAWIKIFVVMIMFSALGMVMPFLLIDPFVGLIRSSTQRQQNPQVSGGRECRKQEEGDDPQECNNGLSHRT